MSSFVRTLGATILLVASIAPFANVASATPVVDALAIKRAAPTNVEAARGWGRGWGWGIGAGLLGGAIIGGALAAPYYYGPPGPYYPGPYYPAPAYYGGPDGGDAVAYCSRRFRSYDPQSGTYLGKDGRRRSCP